MLRRITFDFSQKSEDWSRIKTSAENNSVGFILESLPSSRQYIFVYKRRVGVFLAPEYDSHVMWATYVKSSVCFARDMIYV